LFSFLFSFCFLFVDSIGALRSEFDNDQSGRTARTGYLWQLGQYLKWINDRYSCGIFVLNQVRADFKNGGVTPALGLVWSNCVNTRILVSKTSSVLQDGVVVREMTVQLCPHLPQFSMPFLVHASGVRGFEWK
jgi:hypothetical protein